MNILQMSLSAGLLVLIVVFIRAAALNKLPKTMFLVLWGVALCRLLVPVFIPLKFSVYNVMGEFFKKILPENAVSSLLENTMVSGGLITRIIDVTGILIPSFIPVKFSIHAYSVILGILRKSGNTASSMIENIMYAGSSTAGSSAAVGITEQAMVQEPIFGMAPMTMIWIAGMLAAFTFFTVVYIRNYRELRFACLIRDNEYLNDWLANHKHLRPIAIMQSDRIKTPIVVGILKPRIILPNSMNLDDKQLLSYVLTHEYYHIKRYDAVWKLLLAFALCVHWFNPMVWVMFALVNRDLELTCDEMVIRHFGTTSKTAYAYSLIAMAEQQRKFTPLYNSFSKNAAEERIVSIMKIKKTSRRSAILACALILVLTAGVFVVSAANTPTENPLNVAFPTLHAAGSAPVFVTSFDEDGITMWRWDADTEEWIEVDVETLDNITVTEGGIRIRGSVKTDKEDGNAIYNAIGNAIFKKHGDEHNAGITFNNAVLRKHGEGHDEEMIIGHAFFMKDINEMPDGITTHAVFMTGGSGMPDEITAGGAVYVTGGNGQLIGYYENGEMPAHISIHENDEMFDGVPKIFSWFPFKTK